MGSSPGLTLEELFAGVFLEEGFVGNGAAEVVEHEREDRNDLVFGIAGIVGDGGILPLSVTHPVENWDD